MALGGLSDADRHKLQAALGDSAAPKPSVSVQTSSGMRLIASQHCTLDFDPARPVPHSVVRELLEAASSVPSSANTQPWTVVVVQGETRDRLSKKMLERLDAGDHGEMQYQLLPDEEAMPMAMRGSPQMVAHRRALEFYGAPVHLLLCAPYQQAVVEGVDGIFLDMGSILTALHLGAHSGGLGSNVQLAAASYYKVCREVLGAQLPEDLLVVCGLSIGWPMECRDPRTHPDLSAIHTRLSVDETTRWRYCDNDWLAADNGWIGTREQSLVEQIKSRHCSHNLDPVKVVPKHVVASILEAARNVYSAHNSQPWRVTVVQGVNRDELSAKMLEDFDAGTDGSQTYKKYSAHNTARMQKGKDIYGKELYEDKHGLQRGDTVGRREKYRPNYTFWGAPVLLLLNVPKCAVSGTYVDIGSFMYAILLGMHTYGLGGKPLGSVAKKTEICRQVLGLDGMPEDEHLVCGLAIGWPADGRDPHETPDFFPSRLPVEETTSWAVDSNWPTES